MNDITNKFTNKVMEAIVMRNRGGVLPRAANAETMTVSGKGRSVGGQRPEPTASITAKGHDGPVRIPALSKSVGRHFDTSTSPARNALAQRIRSSRPGNRAAGEEGLRSNITRDVPRSNTPATAKPNISSPAPKPKTDTNRDRERSQDENDWDLASKIRNDTLDARHKKRMQDARIQAARDRPL